MGFEKEVLARARSRYTEAVEEHRRTQRLRTAELYERLPEVARLDSQIRSTMADVMTEAFRYGEDPTEAVAAIHEKNRLLQKRRAEILREAGYAPEPEGPMCRNCSDTGYVGETMCECFRKYCVEEQKKELTSLLNIDKTFDDFCLDYYSPQPDPALRISPRAQMELVYEACLDYARHFSSRDPHGNLFLCGGTGLGKTLLSACIAREVVEQGFSVVYDTAIHLFSCLEKQKFGGASEEDLRMADRIFRCDLLILDDLGTEMTTSFIAPALYNIINSRIMEKQATVISANYNIEQLSGRYTPQIASRLAGEYQRLNFIGQDIRRARGARF